MLIRGNVGHALIDGAADMQRLGEYNAGWSGRPTDARAVPRASGR